MRILYHHRTLGEGAEGVHIREMVRAFRELGHEVKVSALVSDLEASGAREQRRWTQLRRFIPDTAYELAEVAYNVVGTRRVRRDIDAFGPDFVYDRHNSYSTAAVTAARRAGLPLVLEVNAPVVHERTVYENLQLRLPSLAIRYEQRILSAASHLLAVSTPLKDFIVRTHGIAPEKITVLPNGVDPVRFSPAVPPAPVRERFGLAGDAVLLVFSGHARPWHGLDVAVRSLGRLVAAGRDVHLMLLGGGPSEALLRSQAAEAGLAGRVHFAGRVPHDEVPGYLASADIALSSHAAFYASPLKIVEYMAMGKAIVAPSMPNIQDHLAHERSALLFDPESDRSLADAIERLVGDAGLRQALGAEARRLVVDRFNWRRNARLVEELAGSLRSTARTAFAPGG
jgi:glycosyltransferase involved in cell wall biosynthesis